MKVDFRRKIRLLLLDDESRLGEADGPDLYRLHWEFWLQLMMFYDKELTNIVMPQEAERLAAIVEKLPSTESGQIHLHLWGDLDGEASKSLCVFLRRGGFQVIEYVQQADSYKIRRAP